MTSVGSSDGEQLLLLKADDLKKLKSPKKRTILVQKKVEVQPKCRSNANWYDRKSRIQAKDRGIRLSSIDNFLDKARLSN